MTCGRVRSYEALAGGEWIRAYRSDMRVTDNKFIRDRIPEIIKTDGHRAVTRVLQDEDYRAALLARLVEEAREAASSPEDELAGELADVWEVFQALLATLPLAQQELEALAAAKRDKRGGFGRRLFLEYTEPGDLSALQRRCLLRCGPPRE